MMCGELKMTGVLVATKDKRGRGLHRLLHQVFGHRGVILVMVDNA